MVGLERAVDRYADVLVVQFLTAGMERLKSLIVEALEEAVPCKGIYERSDSGSRKLEGLPPVSAWIRQDCLPAGQAGCGASCRRDQMAE